MNFDQTRLYGLGLSGFFIGVAGFAFVFADFGLIGYGALVVGWLLVVAAIILDRALNWEKRKRGTD